MTALRSELSNPLFRNAYALMVNGGLTGVLGLGYWLLAARFYDPAEVGRQSAQNQAMMFLGGLTALNFILIRFIPEMGRRTTALMLRIYFAGGVAAATLAVGFLLTLGWWGPSFAHLSGPGSGLFFVVAVVSWSLFTAQDGVLTGLRQATWVLGKNTTFAALKVMLLVALAGALPGDGITASWVLSALVLLLPIEALVQRRLIPRHVRETASDRPIPSGGQIGRYLVGDYTGTLFYYALCNLVPVVVAAGLDARTNAFFYMAWVLGATVDVLAVNMAMSLTVEGAFDAAGLAVACRSVLRRMALILLPIVVVILVGARPGLSLFGPGYAEQGTPLLRLLAVATLPKALIEVYIGVLRVQRRVRLIALLQGARFAGVLCLVLLLTHAADVTGPGYAVLAVSVAVAIAVVPALLRVTRAPGGAAPHGPEPAGDVPPQGIGGVLPGEAEDAPLETPERARPRRRIAWSAVSSWLLFAGGLGLYWIPLRHVRLRHMNGYGLISVLPVATIAGGGLLVVAFMYTLWLRRPYRALLLLQLVAIVVSLHGLAPALEPYARPPTAWQHNGFVEYISRTGAADYTLDARFSWPGFFALVAFVTRAAGVHDLEPILHWAPVASQLLYLAPLYLILRVMRANWRAQWLAAWLFVVADWVGQDYFSPQGFGYLLYLVFAGILLNWFRPEVRPSTWVARTGRVRTFLRGPLASGERPPPDTPVAERTVLLLLLVVLFAVTTASHQLTPFLIMFVCAALVLVRRSTARGLPVLLAVMVASWVSFMTTAYWAGHVSDLFSGAGALLSNLTGGVAGRVSKGSESLATVQTGRILIAATVMILALLGALRRRLRRIDDRVALVLLAVPFLAAGLQNYGGEIALRVYFFVLPGACILAAYLFFPTTFTAPRRTIAVCAAAVCGLLIAGGFLFVRFGNETFEQVRPGDVRAFDAILRETPHNMIDVVWLADPQDDAGYFPMMPWGARQMEHFDYTAVRAPADPADVSAVVRALQEKPGGYFITTRGNEAYNHYNYGLAASYGDRMRAALAASPQLRSVVVNGDAAVYALRQPPAMASPPPMPARAAHFGVRRTTWTPIGLFTIPVLIVVLAAREVQRMRLRPGEEWRLQPLTGWSVFLVVVLGIVIIERFVALGA
jgi:O-antigen/teichoic acid export membrane protein